MEEKNPKRYELAYLIQEPAQEETMREISEILTQESALTNYQEPLVKKELAYPIEKLKTAYFGWTRFTTQPHQIKNIQEKLFNLKLVLRFLLTEMPSEVTAKKVRKKIRSRIAKPESIQTQDKETKEGKKVNLEEIDKKLEEILK